MCGTPNAAFIYEQGISGVLERRSSLARGLLQPALVHPDSHNDPLCEHATGTPLSNLRSEFLFPGRADCTEEVSEWKLLVTQNEIQLGVQWLAHVLNKRFRGQSIVLTGILKGVFVFMTDLCKLLTIPYSVYFLEASSYLDGQTQTERVEFLSQLVPSKFHGRQVVLLDELYDNGKTMHSILQELLNNEKLQLRAENVFTCTLLMKHKEENKYPLPDFSAINILPDVWLVGYGLDDGGEKRGWPHLFAIPKSEHVTKHASDGIFEEGEAGVAVQRRLRAIIKDRLQQLSSEMSQASPLLPSLARNNGFPSLE
jgi:hypoxanthine phosphoribosyltransferase